jgi:hypothetical protein
MWTLSGRNVCSHNLFYVDILAKCLHKLATSLEEIDECFIKMAQDLLQWNRGDFPKPLIVLFQWRKHGTQVFIVEALLLVVERIRLLAQGPIVDEAATPECTSQHLLLRVRGADAVLVGFSLFHVLHHNTHDVECQADNSACGRWCFIPKAFARGPHTTF